MANRWNTQCNGVCHRVTEHNCGKESEFYDPSVRTSVQDFVKAFMQGETPVEVGFRGIVDDIPTPVSIYPDLCQCGNTGGKYSFDEATELASAASEKQTSEARQDTTNDADKF